MTPEESARHSQGGVGAWLRIELSGRMECQQDEVIQGSRVDLRQVEVSLVYIVRFCLKTFYIYYSILFGGRDRGSR